MSVSVPLQTHNNHNHLRKDCLSISDSRILSHCFTATTKQRMRSDSDQTPTEEVNIWAGLCSPRKKPPLALYSREHTQSSHSMTLLNSFQLFMTYNISTRYHSNTQLQVVPVLTLLATNMLLLVIQ